jgi:GrpB-like predicted nucleotidyltransferase (UPF0157 family)
LADDVGAMKEPAPSQQRSGGTRPRAIEVVAYDPEWPGRFAELGRELRAGLGEVALRIDHIGSTAVPGLAAKWALLFRDYLRAHPAAAAEYEAKKRTLAVRFRDDRHAYTRVIIRQADEWAQAQGWQPGPSDA